MLSDNSDVLERIAHALLERETLATKELDLLLKNQELPPIEETLVKPTSATTETGTGEKKKPESNGGFSGGNVPDPEPMPS